MLKVLMISTFGPKVRGISPYSDSLATALSTIGSIDLTLMDYQRAFPNFLLPSKTDYAASNDLAYIDYLKPKTWNVAKEKSYDVVHIQYWSPAFLPIIYAVTKKLKNNSIKVVLTWHNPSPHEKIPLLSGLETRLISMCDSIICHTESGAKILKKYSPNKSINIIHHGCETSRTIIPTNKDYETCNLSPDYKYLLYFGNIRPYKGVEMLLDAWERISSSHCDTKLIIAGRLWESGSSIFSRLIHKVSGTEKYSNLIRNKLLDHSKSVISDLQFIPQEKLISYLRISRFSVFPYQSFESQSGATALAAGYSCPILTTNVGGLKELAISNEFVSKELNADSLSKLLNTQLSQYNNELREKQLRKAQKFSWISSAKMHISAYNEA